MPADGEVAGEMRGRGCLARRAPRAAGWPSDLLADTQHEIDQPWRPRSSWPPTHHGEAGHVSKTVGQKIHSSRGGRHRACGRGSYRPMEHRHARGAQRVAVPLGTSGGAASSSGSAKIWCRPPRSSGYSVRQRLPDQAAVKALIAQKRDGRCLRALRGHVWRRDPRPAEQARWSDEVTVPVR